MSIHFNRKFSSMRMLRSLSVVLAVLGLGACASMKGMHTHAVAIDADQVQASHSLSSASFSAAAWPDDSWWSEFGDSQLNQLMGDALSGQPNLRIAEARVREAQALAGVVGASLYPQVNANLKSTRQRFSEDGTVPPPIAGTWQTINDASLGVNYELDFWGKNRAAVDAALGRATAAEVDLQAARLMLTTTLARTYFRLDLAYAQLDLAQDTLNERAQTLELTKKRVAAQIDSQLELTQAEAALPAARGRIATIHESIALLNNQIASLEGKGPDAGLMIQRPRLAKVGLVQLPTDLPAELIGHRPDVVADRWRVEAASQDIKVAKARFYPDISLNALVGLQSLGFDNFLDAGSRVLGVGPAISLPIFDGGRLRGNLGVHQAEYDAAVERYNATVIAAVHDVVDQLVSLHWLQQQMDERDEALRLAQHAWLLAQARYRSGLANYLQVLSAENQVLEQKQLLIASQSRQRELRLNLIRALGGGYQPASMTAPTAVAHRQTRGNKS
ncbi:efflux transporter outer membrane subunit [Rhodanobacter sp. Soil772]|uniref:efflux transporter outer membrane subunit n=1 Tax=Rhodanobacter sp. Soil772 TaxID=1736406 RepID=UPI000A8F9DCB|nr:efflux transporter outer membrane subunit [Rhodanobacter sp. Soil772]